ncbi:hypothetical protein ABPG75_002469 [Micractinium tetrahymenae]
MPPPLPPPRTRPLQVSSHRHNRLWLRPGMHGPFSPRLSCASSMLEEDEEDFLESVESLKQSSASLDLHESGSCLLLLPCGLLPEELAELEGSAVASAMHVEEAVSSLTLTSAEDEPPSPHTPMGADSALLLGPTAAVVGAHIAPAAERRKPVKRGSGGGAGEGTGGIAAMDGIEPAEMAGGPARLPIEPAAVS